jgi:hypothetical protein
VTSRACAVAISMGHVKIAVCATSACTLRPKMHAEVALSAILAPLAGVSPTPALRNTSSSVLTRNPPTEDHSTQHWSQNVNLTRPCHNPPAPARSQIATSPSWPSGPTAPPSHHEHALLHGIAPARRRFLAAVGVGTSLLHAPEDRRSLHIVARKLRSATYAASVDTFSALDVTLVGASLQNKPRPRVNVGVTLLTQRRTPHVIQPANPTSFDCHRWLK